MSLCIDDPVGMTYNDFGDPLILLLGHQYLTRLTVVDVSEVFQWNSNEICYRDVDIYVSLSINYITSSDPLTFHRAPSSGHF